VSAWLVTLDPGSVIENRAELSLNSPSIQIDGTKGIDWGTSEIMPFLATGKYGEPITDSRVPNRVVTIPLLLGAGPNGTEAQEEEARAKLQAKVALFQREGGVLERKRGNGEPLYADIVYAALTIPDIMGELGGVEPNVNLVLTCKPDFYGEPIILDELTGTGNIVGILQQGGKQAVIAGDYPARATITLTDTSGNNQRSMLWGFRSASYSSAASAALEYDAYTLSPINGAESVTNSSTYSGHAIEMKEPPVESWYPFLETTIASGSTPLTHLGSYRVWARVWSNGSAKLRLAWGGDDATEPTFNEGRELPLSEWYLLDLGEIRLEQPPVGEHWWKGILQAYVGIAPADVFVDRLWFQPVGENAGKLRATSIPSSTAANAAKEPTEAASNNTLHAGTAWSNPTYVTAGHVGEYASCNLGAKAETQALYVHDFGFAIPSGATILGIEVKVTASAPLNFTHLVKAGAFAGTVLNGTSGGGPSDLWGTTWTPAQINATNFGIAYWALNPNTHESLCVANSVIVTVYYSVSVSSLPVDAVLYDDGQAALTWQGAFREDRTTTAYARISEETGDLVRLPPSGLEERPVQLFVKNSRGLLPSPSTNEAGEADSGIDTIKAVVSYRPAWIGRV
jgi:uncharacterized protein (DUF433 family)